MYIVWLESVIGVRGEMSVLFVASKGVKHNIDIVCRKEKTDILSLILTLIC